MTEQKSIFFCAIGGSGMLPLALIMKARGYDVRGSDRGRDQGRTPERFAFLEDQGITLFPQDGRGVTDDVARLIVSTAVEDTVPDVCAAKEKNIPVIRRSALLAALFNGAKTRLAVAGTSGKSTTTGMIGWILHKAGRNPTVMNGAVMKNFVTSACPIATALVGDPDLFVSEVDESDGSIEGYSPTIAVLNNIALDHKSMDELRALFASYVRKAAIAVINRDNEEAAQLITPSTISYSMQDQNVTLYASGVTFELSGMRFRVTHRPSSAVADVRLSMVGRHNVSNALAAIGAAMAVGVSLEGAVTALEDFAGIGRRMEKIGHANGIAVFDDFAHNPDKIAASLDALHQFDGRLLVLFQPHGYGPLKLLLDGFAETFAKSLRASDKLFIVDALYLGGTVDRSVTSAHLAQKTKERGVDASYYADRADAVQNMLKQAQSGDRIIVMGARDDTLPVLARSILDSIAVIAKRP